MKTAILLVVLAAAGCGTAVDNRPHMLIAVLDDSAVTIDEAVAGCRVWSDFADCDASASPNTTVATGPLVAGYDAYAITAADSITVDVAAVDAARLVRTAVIAHEFGHRLGIVEHLLVPASLMSAETSVYWNKAELSQADRDAMASNLAAQAHFDGLPRVGG